MADTAGKSVIPYPWEERRKFNDARRLVAPILKVARVLSIVGLILSPPTILLRFWATLAFRHYNDSWSRRGLFIMALAVATWLIIQSTPITVFDAWVQLLKSFGSEATSAPRDAAIHVVLQGLPYGLLIQGFAAYVLSFETEKATNAFMAKSRPTPGMRLRARRNRRSLAHGGPARRKGDGYVRLGVIVDDRIPWRRTRYGMVVERPIHKIGHGAILGSTGMGKTRTAETFAHYALTNDCAMLFYDFKASVTTRDGLIAIARDANVPLQVLDIGFGSTDSAWIDLFNWGGSPADMASVLVECLQFPEGEGGTRHYRNIAEAWLPTQIEAAQRVGLREGEGMFDFLLDTCDPASLRNRIDPMRTSKDEATKALYESWTKQAGLHKANDLQGLRSELLKVVRSAGARLKPNAEHPEPVSVRKAMQEGGLVYIGMAPGVNDVVVKVIGSFLLKELTIYSAERARYNPDDLRDVIVIPDEASQMGERSVMMNPIYTMAREARIHIWPSFQSFGDWDQSTVDAIQSNARNFIIHNTTAKATQAEIASTLTQITCMSMMSDEETKQRAFQGQSIGISGDTRMEIVYDEHLRANVELSAIEPYHAYIWFRDGVPVTRTRWWGKGRVRGDKIKGDAPLVRIVPYSLALEPPSTAEEGYGRSEQIEDDAPAGVQSASAPGSASGSPTESGGIGFFRDDEPDPTPRAAAATPESSWLLTDEDHAPARPAPRAEPTHAPIRPGVRSVTQAGAQAPTDTGTPSTADSSAAQAANVVADDPWSDATPSPEGAPVLPRSAAASSGDPVPTSTSSQSDPTPQQQAVEDDPWADVPAPSPAAAVTPDEVNGKGTHGEQPGAAKGKSAGDGNGSSGWII